MFPRTLLIFLLIFCGLVFATKAQRPPEKSSLYPLKNPVSNLHQKFIKVKEGKVQIDSFSILPKTFFIFGIPPGAYELDYLNANLTWRQKPNLDSVLITYRSFPYKLNSVVKRLDYDSIQNNFLIRPTVYNSGFRKGNDNFFNFGNITYNGSFGRAITFGNSQDAVLTSNLNLQISGYLADSIEISAAITDNNIPFQPDGSTAQINDFDKIFLQFKKKTWALSMGDIDLRQNQNYFLNFYKRLQGASFETSNRLAEGISNKSLLSAAIAKGKFTRNIFQGQEGNQGPYRLQGANNELYFIVLAGTEKVFIDGQMLQRGEDQDYVINYNTAEVAFTPRRMITKDSRIQVEFEYSNQNYLNVNLYFSDEVNLNEKLKVRFAIFRNSDSRNSPINQTLDGNQKKFLNLLGDSINRAFYPVAPLDTPSAGKILYKKIDTVYVGSNGLYYHDSVFVFSMNSSSNLYNLSFTDVGLGNGNYVLNQNGVNGRVFQWIAPSNGQKQGQFEAAQFLVTPKTQQVMTIGADYAVTKNTTLNAEFAKSHNDLNTLSSIGKENDNGYATRLQLKNIHPFTGSAKGLQLTSSFSYEYVDARFQPLERLRPVEFARDWGLPLVLTPDNETLYSAGFQLNDKKKNAIKYELSGYNRGTNFTGVRSTLSHFQTIKGWVINDQISLSNGNSTTDRGYYLRPFIDVSKKFTWLSNYTLGINYAVEHNESRNKISDSVSAISFAFETLQAYVKSPEKNPNHWGITYMTRDNSYPYGKELAKGDRSENVNVFVELSKNKHHQFRFNATFRNLQILNPNVTFQQPDKSLLGRAEYIFNEWKGLVTGNSLYELGSGQEQKRAYSYVEVPAGTGQYAWIDYNADGFQQLNEFVLAQFPDQAKFIRVFTPTNQYVKANYNTFNYSIHINPRALINPSKIRGFVRFVSRINLHSSLQLMQKEQANGFVELNPFKSLLNDTTLITRNIIFVNTVSFNKLDPRWGFDVNNSRNSNKSLLTYGYQTQTLQEWNLRARLNLSKSFLFNTTIKKGINQLLSTNKDFTNSNYNLDQFSAEPDISFTRKSNFRLTLGYKYTEKKNSPVYGGETYTANSINSEMKYNIVQTTSLQAKFTYSNIRYDGNPNSTVSYVILDGLLPGKNYLWNLEFTKRLGTNLELGIQYEGRKPGEGSAIHTGRASLRALL